MSSSSALPVAGRPAWSTVRLKLVVAVLFSIVCLSWGTTWLGIKMAVATVPPFFASGVRFLIAFPVFLLIARSMRAPLLFPKEARGFFAVVVLLYFALPYLLINAGEQQVSSGLAALLFSTMPVFILIFSALVLKERIRPVQLAGIALGFFSLLKILQIQGVGFGYDSLYGAAAVLGAAVLHAFCYVLTKKRGANIHVVTFNTLPIGVAGLLLTLFGLVLEKPSLSAMSAESAGALLYLGIVASVGGFLAYFHLLKQLDPTVLSFVFLIFPVIAVVLAGWLEHKGISREFLLYGALLLAGFGLTKVRSGSTAK